jgi:hypothetical protein
VLAISGAVDDEIIEDSVVVVSEVPTGGIVVPDPVESVVTSLDVDWEVVIDSLVLSTGERVVDCPTIKVISETPTDDEASDGVV